LHPENDKERQEAIAQAAKNPSLYQRLLTDFKGQRLPDLLNNILVRSYGVARGNADEVVEVFKQTFDYAGLLVNGILHSESIAEEENEEDGSGQVDDAATVQESSDVDFAVGMHRNEQPSPSSLHKAGSTVRKCEIPVGRDRDVVMYLPNPCSKKDLARIIRWIEFSEEILTEDYEEIHSDD
jgi:hypothetical protein